MSSAAPTRCAATSQTGNPRLYWTIPIPAWATSTTRSVTAAGRAALGEGPALAAWLAPGRRQLVGDGYLGVCAALTAPLTDAAAQDRLAAAAGAALNYFAGHRDRLGYAVRLRRGQAIGSGLVEGAIKERVNLRLKRTGARWQAGVMTASQSFCSTDIRVACSVRRLPASTRANSSPRPCWRSKWAAT